jgi:hypothetical protein
LRRPLPTNSLSLETSRNRDGFTTPQPLGASSSVASGTQSSLNQISNLESIKSTVMDTVSSSEYETSSHSFKTTRSEFSPTAIARSSHTESSTVPTLSETQGTFMLSYSSSIAQASDAESGSQAPRFSSVSTEGRSTRNS